MFPGEVNPSSMFWQHYQRPKSISSADRCFCLFSEWYNKAGWQQWYSAHHRVSGMLLLLLGNLMGNSCIIIIISGKINRPVFLMAVEPQAHKQPVPYDSKCILNVPLENKDDSGYLEVHLKELANYFFLHLWRDCMFLAHWQNLLLNLLWVLYLCSDSVLEHGRKWSLNSSYEENWWWGLLPGIPVRFAEHWLNLSEDQYTEIHCASMLLYWMLPCQNTLVVILSVCVCVFLYILLILSIILKRKKSNASMKQSSVSVSKFYFIFLSHLPPLLFSLSKGYKNCYNCSSVFR